MFEFANAQVGGGDYGVSRDDLDDREDEPSWVNILQFLVSCILFEELYHLMHHI